MNNLEAIKDFLRLQEQKIAPGTARPSLIAEDQSAEFSYLLPLYMVFAFCFGLGVGCAFIVFLVVAWL